MKPSMLQTSTLATGPATRRFRAIPSGVSMWRRVSNGTGTDKSGSRRNREYNAWHGSVGRESRRWQDSVQNAIFICVYGSMPYAKHKFANRPSDSWQFNNLHYDSAHAPRWDWRCGLALRLLESPWGTNPEGTMTNSSPCQPPRGAITPAEPARYGEIFPFSFRSRLGRVRDRRFGGASGAGETGDGSGGVSDSGRR